MEKKIIYKEFGDQTMSKSFTLVDYNLLFP